MTDNLTLIIVTIVIVTILLIVGVIYFIRSSKTKRIKKILENLDIEKNKIESSPIIPELAKVESFLNNPKLEVMYKEWTERLQNIKDVQIPKLTDMILEAEYSLSQKDYKSTVYKIAKLEMELYKVRTNSEFLLGEIKEITSSEERSRGIITEFKIKFRNLHQKFQETKLEYGTMGEVVQKQFEIISKRFEDFEIIMDNNEYTEVNEIIKVISDLLKHMTIVVEEVPSIVLLAYSVIPKRVTEVQDIYNIMVKSGYPLDYLNVEYNIDEANKKIGDIIVRTKNLNLEDSLFELKVLLDYFDSLFSDFEKEKIARINYTDNNVAFKNKLSKINSVVDDIFSQIEDIKNIYNLSDDDIEVLKVINNELKELNANYKLLLDHTTNTNAFAYSKLLKELEGLGLSLAKIEDKLDNSLDAIGSMRDDEVRARQQLDEIKVILKDSKLKMREYNLPYIPQSYYIELKEASIAIREIVKELDKKPITISILNTRVDTARDLVLKLYTRTEELIKIVAFAETALVYGNRFRSSYDGLSNKLNLSEQLFLKGEYQKSLELTISLLNKIEPGIYEKLVFMYNPNS
jgi:Negative regulator of septation ring formation